jgi:4-aminobutyrate aminotransferase-like enzyme
VAATKTIELRTAIPGPRSQEILARKERVIADPLSIYLPLVVQEARGAALTDVDGNTFIDFTGGVGCLNVGHSHPRVVAAAQEQLERFAHTDFTIVPYEVYVTLAERLLERAPFRGPAKAAFFNAGTEAVENSIKFARSYTKRPAVIAFEGAFHGRTLLSMTMTSKTHPYKAGLGPFAPEVYRVPFATRFSGALPAGVHLQDHRGGSRPRDRQDHPAHRVQRCAQPLDWRSAVPKLVEGFGGLDQCRHRHQALVQHLVLSSGSRRRCAAHHRHGPAPRVRRAYRHPVGG